MIPWLIHLLAALAGAVLFAAAKLTASNRDRPLSCALYARVSTTDQNCDLQLRELRQYVQARGWTVAKEYVDTGWSGAKASRPQFDLLMRDARKRSFDAVLVWKLDRWGRSVSHLFGSLDELVSLGVRWIAVTQNIDTDQSNPMAKFMLGIIALVAEFEREMIRERVRAGMSAAQHRGKRMGRPRAVFDRTRAVELRKQGKSIREIATALSVGRGTVERLIGRAA